MAVLRRGDVALVYSNIKRNGLLSSADDVCRIREACLWSLLRCRKELVVPFGINNLIFKLQKQNDVISKQDYGNVKVDSMQSSSNRLEYSVYFLQKHLQRFEFRLTPRNCQADLLITSANGEVLTVSAREV